MKKYIVHYHIYKNAGSSVDNAIKQSFGNDHLLELDKDVRYRQSAHFDKALIESIIAEGTDYVAFSAHKMTPTVHLSEKNSFLPIVHVRHPLLRAASVYRYEKKRPDEKPGKEFAKQLDFPEWLQWSLNQDNYIESRNYQTTLLSIPDVETESSTSSNICLDRVKQRLESIPIVGVVEYFSESCRYYDAYIGRHFPEFKMSGAHANKTKDVSDWKDELKSLQTEVPRDIIVEFEEKNQLDYELFWLCVQKLRDLEIRQLEVA